LESIKNCFDGGLAGASLQYFDEKLYLFGGNDINGTLLTNFTGICVYEFENLFSGQWVLELNNTFVSVDGGSAVQDNFLYSVVGVEVNESRPPNIFRIDLNNLSNGWSKLSVTGCGTELLRNSFGYTHINESLFINGGFGVNNRSNKMLNSLLKLDLNNSSPEQTCEVLMQDLFWPSKRNGASLEYINAQLILFGGQNEGEIFNDLWIFDILTSTWFQISTYGDYPPARYRHGAGVQGNYMIIKGGIGANNGILQDAFLFEAKNFNWAKVTPLPGSSIPPPSYSSCVVVNFPKIYSVGGVETYSVTLSLWEYDLTTNLYTQIYDNRSSLGVQGHGCFLSNDSDHYFITTVFGASDLADTPVNGMFVFNLSSERVTPVFKSNPNPNLPARSYFSMQYIGKNTIVLSGGERYLQEFLKDQWIINTRNFTSTRMQDLPIPSYLAASSFYNKTLKIFSGFSNSGFSYLSPSSEISMNITLDKTSQTEFLSPSCGRGLYLVENECFFCPPGTYNDQVFSHFCLPCPAGTSNPNKGSTSITQCIPCPNKYYSKIKSSICLSCSSSETCEIGSSPENKLSSADEKKLDDFRKHKKQPNIPEPNNIQSIKMILWICCLSLIFVFTVIFFLDYRIRIFLSFYDFFRNMHFEVHSRNSGTMIERELTLSPSKFGGYLSIVTVILLLSLGVNSLIIFLMTNEVDEVIFVPINSLIDDKNYDSETLHVTLMFSSYRGRCDQKFLNITTSDHIMQDSLDTTDEPPFCYFNLKAKLSKMIESGSFISFSLTDQASYTSDINIRLKTSSSVPGEESSVTQHLTVSSKLILRGDNPSVFTFSLLPAYYRKELVFGDESHKGYVLSTGTSPLPGSLLKPEGIGLTYGLKILVLLERVELGYTTYKYPKVGTFEFIFKFMNDFPGTVVLIGFFLWFIEFFISYCSGKRSGRMRLARRHILLEKRRRNPRLLEQSISEPQDPGIN
jgi:N-acetylneuraminic acid mutarotase